MSEYFHISAETDTYNFGPNYGTDLITKKEHTGRKGVQIIVNEEKVKTRTKQEKWYLQKRQANKQFTFEQ